MTEFMNAVSQDKLNTIDKYLADGGNPNVHNEVYTPCVAEKRSILTYHTKIYFYFLQYCVFKFSSWRGQHNIWASVEGHAAVIQVLLENRADISFKKLR